MQDHTSHVRFLRVGDRDFVLASRHSTFVDLLEVVDESMLVNFDSLDPIRLNTDDSYRNEVINTAVKHPTRPDSLLVGQFERMTVVRLSLSD